MELYEAIIVHHNDQYNTLPAPQYHLRNPAHATVVIVGVRRQEGLRVRAGPVGLLREPGRDVDGADGALGRERAVGEVRAQKLGGAARRQRGGRVL